jgi:hypothetical protein
MKCEGNVRAQTSPVHEVPSVGWVGGEPVYAMCGTVINVGGATHWINVGVATVVCSLPAWCRGSS